MSCTSAVTILSILGMVASCKVNDDIPGTVGSVSCDCVRVSTASSSESDMLLSPSVYHIVNWSCIARINSMRRRTNRLRHRHSHRQCLIHCRHPVLASYGLRYMGSQRDIMSTRRVSFMAYISFSSWQPFSLVSCLPFSHSASFLLCLLSVAAFLESSASLSVCR